MKIRGKRDFIVENIEEDVIDAVGVSDEIPETERSMRIAENQ